MSTSLAVGPDQVRQGSLIDRVARRVVLSQLADLQLGRLVVRDPYGQTSHGQDADLDVLLSVHRSRFYSRVLWGGTLAAADSYLQGDWDCSDLTSLFRLFVRNQQAANRLDSRLTHVARWAHRLYHWCHANTRAGSQRNIQAHYDLGNDFYRLWLDETLAYSSGIFPRAGASLAEASREKFDRICRRLDLQPGDQVLEIGTGWGGFALHAARNYGCSVTTTTISSQQYHYARQQIQQAGLSDRITLLQQDYRDLHGQFDKLVSIEMIEAVGHRFLDVFFRQCSRLLRPHGSLLLQAIVMPDRQYEQYLSSVDFIRRYVFPGGSLPCLGALLDSVARATDLRLASAEDFAPHYAETLRHWQQNFTRKAAEIRHLGYCEEFLRMWHYYLCYCEAAFAERYLGLVQIQFDKPACVRRAVSSETGQGGAAASLPGAELQPRRPVLVSHQQRI